MKTPLTIRALVQRYLDGPARRLKTFSTYQSRAMGLIMPAHYLGDVYAEALDYAQIDNWVHDLSHRGPRVAYNAVKVLSAAYNFGVRAGLVTHNAVRVYDLPKPYKPSPEDRRPALTDDELQHVLVRLSPSEGVTSDQVAIALRLMLLTGCRPSEILDARRSWIAGHWLTIPTANSKTSRRQEKYLSKAALALIAMMPDRGDALFPHLKLSAVSMALRKAYREGQLPAMSFTASDMRTACATGLARLDVREDVIREILGHAPDSVSRKWYIKHDYRDQKRDALEKWAKHLQKLQRVGSGSFSKAA